jgi:hypothetical protein
LPRTVQLPDGRILTVPDDATPDQLAALRNQLASKYANLTTGEGMDARAVQQSRSSLARGVQPNYAMMVAEAPKQGLESGLSSPAVDPQNAAAMRTGAAIGSIAGGAIANPIATGRALVGSTALAYAGGKSGKYLFGDQGEQIGKIGGGIVGGVLGGAGWSPKPGASLFDLLSGSATPAAESEAASLPLSQSPYADEYAATRAAQRATLRRELAGAGTPGSSAQESGYTPAVTKVPIRPEPSSPLTPESVPGPDTSGKGNLLTPLAKQGDSRAAQELLRRGRRVLYVPDDSTGSMSADDFQRLLAGLDQK